MTDDQMRAESLCQRVAGTTGDKSILGAIGGGLAGLATPIPGGAALGAAAGSAAEDRIRGDQKKPEPEEKGMQGLAENFAGRLFGGRTNETSPNAATQREEAALRQQAPQRESDRKRPGADDERPGARRLQDQTGTTFPGPQRGGKQPRR